MATKTMGKTAKSASKSQKNTFADVAVISLNDFQRIQDATKSTNIHEENNRKNILKQQTEQKLSTQKNLKEKMKEIDRIKHEREKVNKEELDEQTTQKLLIKVFINSYKL